MSTKLKLVGAKRYVDARISTSTATTYGQVVTIEDPEIAEQLKAVTFVNRYNEQAPMFEEVNDAEEQKEKPAARTRRKTTRRSKTAA